MINEKKYTKAQLIFLLVLRFVIGWHILYEGISKVMNPQWTSANFLQESQGILSGFSGWILSNSSLLSIVDFLNIWGLVLIGLGLIFGFLFKPAAIAGSVLIFIYYLSVPPLVGYEYTLPSDGSNLVINRTLIEAVALFGLALFPTNEVFGLDYFISSRQKGTLQHGRK
ncbi:MULTISPECIES: DoxX family membrane protein [Dysgonomonadaceae]|jgi:thiosulfate dehydrogenase [quinone] large subunit|uniref:DoxX family membrane protein n=1 Tax=Dysgonomonadaceae TaxID=2005520 RepID=UPI000F0CAE82|nr:MULTISPECIES: DoxX family membrane protein [unclassified Proteiniphilum]MDD3542703.1 DoxX family membrane protein [Petrimonas sp.]BBD44968.1 DoxX family protein [Petrimonas sp. IBARAKI]